MRLGRLILPLFAFLAIGGFFAYQSASSSRPAQAAGASINFPTSTCTASATTVNFKWFPIPGQSQWLDVGTSDSFAPGTFSGRGALSADLGTLTVTDLQPRTAYFWRINTLTETGWVTSDTGTFVPCGAPVLLWGPLTCDGKLRARVQFRWAPSAQGVEVQYVDIGHDPSFPTGSFVSSSAQVPSSQTYSRSGLNGNLVTYFRVSALGPDGNWSFSSTGAFNGECVGPVNPNLYGSADRLFINRVGINAPVNVRDVPMNAVLGDPSGPQDVVRYNFPYFDGLGGYPGNGGTTMIAGHLDYRNYGLAVFAPLRVMVPGDIIEYQRADGGLVTYQVVWVDDLPNDYSFGDLAKNTSVETMVLITCNGTFNWSIEEYSHRRVVYATKVATP